MALPVADQACLDQWWQAAVHTPGQLPVGLTEVHARLVRAVGRGPLPSGGLVFAKLMWFPRAKDRLRYFFRPLPAVHEGAMLRYCREQQIQVPEVLWVGSRRAWRSPRVSMLVTAALPVVEAPAGADGIVAVVGQLLAAGVYHPDLHAGNFLALEPDTPGGAVAVIDLQSARRRPRGVSVAQRRAMLGRLLEDPEPWRAAGAAAVGLTEMAAALRRAELCSAEEVSAAVAVSKLAARRALAGRIQRCFRESTQFTVRHGWSGTLCLRRAECEPAELAGGRLAGDWVEGGPELVRYWIGDRCREILESQPPILRGLYRCRWRSGRHRVWLGSASIGTEAFSAAVPGLLAAHDRYEQLTRGAW